MKLHELRREEIAMRRWRAEVSEAARTFESRWTWAALRRVDRQLHHRLKEQLRLLEQALNIGSAAEIERQGAAAVRGYAEAAQALQDAGEADDAFVIGEDPRTGFRVIIGQQRAAARRELNGKAVIWITPDEVAAVLANLEAFKPIAAVKTLFPGAEILDVRRAVRKR